MSTFQTSVNVVTPIELGKPEEAPTGPSTWNVEIFVQTIKEMVCTKFSVGVLKRNRSVSTMLCNPIVVEDWKICADLKKPGCLFVLFRYLS
jgi:hypothetical protein